MKKIIPYFLVGLIAWGASFLWFSGNLEKPSGDVFFENQKFLGGMVKKIGVEKTYIYFKKNFYGYEPASRHYLGHFLGEKIYKELGEPGISVCDFDLDYGCIHGFVMQGIGEKGSGFVENVMQRCLSFGEENISRKESCIHGVSHTILWLKGYSSEDLAGALSSCDTMLTGDDPPQCYSAIFMEYNLRTLDGEENGNWFQIRTFDPSKPLDPCNLLADKYQRPCYSEMGSFWENSFGSDYQRMAGYCDSVPVFVSKKSCYWGIARSMADVYNYDVGKIGDECKKISTQGMLYSCIYGAAVVSFNNKPLETVGLCDYLSGMEKDDCLKLHKAVTGN